MVAPIVPHSISGVHQQANYSHLSSTGLQTRLLQMKPHSDKQKHYTKEHEKKLSENLFHTTIVSF